MEFAQVVIDENPYCTCGHALIWHLPDPKSAVRDQIKPGECSRCDCKRFVRLQDIPADSEDVSDAP